MNKTIKLVFVISLFALALTGCRSKSGESAASPSTPPTTQSPTSSATRKASARGNAVTVPMTPTIRSSLVDAYLMKMMAQYPNESTDKVKGPENAHVGKVHRAYYAVADISLADHPITAQDGPHVWHSPNGSDWEYVGDTGGDVCGQVPRALVRAWGMPCD